MVTMATLLSVQVQADVAHAEAGLARVNQRIGQMGTNALGQASHFTRLGFLMTGMGIQAGLAARAMGGFIASGIKGFMEYDSAARKTWTQVEKGTATLEQIKKVGIEVAKVIPVPLASLQEGLYDIFSSMDVNLKEAETILRAFAKGSVAGFTDLATAGKSTIAVLNGFRRPVSDVNKIMDEQFEIVKISTVEYDQLAKVIGRAIPSAVRAGQSFHDLGGMMSFMTRAGMPAAQAATSAARAFDLLTNPKFGERMKEFGIDVADATGKFRPMNEIATELREKLKGLSDEARAHKLKELTAGAGGVIQAMRFMDLVIKDSNNTLADYTRRVRDSAGAMEEAYQKAQSMKTSIQQLKNLWEILKIELVGGLAPAFATLVGLIQKVIFFILDLSDETKENIGRAIAFTAALAGLVSVILTTLGAISMTTGALVLLGMSTGTATKLAFSFYGVIGLLPGVIFLVIQNWDKLTALFTKTGPLNDITERFKKFGDTVTEAWNKISKIFKEKGWEDALKAIPQFLEDISEGFKNIDIPKIAESWAEGFNNFIDKIDWSKIGRSIGGGLGKIFGTLSEFGVEIANGLLTLMGAIDWFTVGKGAAKFIASFIMGAFVGVWQSGVLGDLAGMIIKNLGPIVQTALVLALAPRGLTRALALALGKIPLIGTFAAWAVGALRGLGIILFAPIASAISWLGGAVGLLLYTTLVQHIGPRLLAWGIVLKSRIISAILAAATGLGTAFGPLATAIMTGLRAVFTIVQAGAALLFSPVGLIISAAIAAGLIYWKWGPEIEEWAQNLEDAVQEKIGEKIEQLKKWAKTEWTKFVDSFKQDPDSGPTFLDKMKTKLENGKRDLQTTFDGVKESIGNFFSDLGARLSEALSTLGENIMNSPPMMAIKNLWTEIQNAWDKGFGYFIGFLHGLGLRLLGAFTGIFVNITATILTSLANAWTGITTWFLTFIAQASIWAGEVINNISNWFSQLPGKFETWWTETKEKVSTKWNEMVEDAKKKSEEIITNISNWFTQLPGKFENWFNDTKQRVINKWNQMVEDAKKKAGEIISGIQTWIEQLPGKMQTWFETTRQRVSTKMSEMVSNAKTGAQDMLNGIVEWVSKIPDKVTGFLRDTVNGIGNWFKTAYSKMKTLGSNMWKGFLDGITGSPKSRMEYFLIDAMARMNKDMVKFTPVAENTMKNLAYAMAKSFDPELSTNLNSVAVGPGLRAQAGSASASMGPNGAAVSAPGILIENLNISSPTPEQEFMDFERKIMALEMRVGRR